VQERLKNVWKVRRSIRSPWSRSWIGRGAISLPDDKIANVAGKPVRHNLRGYNDEQSQVFLPL
jgi:hypothetical protein